MIQRSSIGGEDGGMRAFECIIRSGGGMGVVCWPTLWLFDCLSLLVTDFCTVLSPIIRFSAKTGRSLVWDGAWSQKPVLSIHSLNTVARGWF